jgi:hypothetical protein
MDWALKSRFGDKALQVALPGFLTELTKLSGFRIYGSVAVEKGR